MESPSTPSDDPGLCHHPRVRRGRSPPSAIPSGHFSDVPEVSHPFLFEKGVGREGRYGKDVQGMRQKWIPWRSVHTQAQKRGVAEGLAESFVTISLLPHILSVSPRPRRSATWDQAIILSLRENY